DGVHSLWTLIGPSLTDVSWEGIYGVGLAYAMAAAAAMRFLPGRARVYAVALLGITLFAICNGGPGQSLPILRQFRGHFRAFMVAALPVALLAGALTDRLAAVVPNDAEIRQGIAWWMGGAALLCLFGIAWTAVDARTRLLPQPYWFTIPLTVPALL